MHCIYRRRRAQLRSHGTRSATHRLAGLAALHSCGQPSASRGPANPSPCRACASPSSSPAATQWLFISHGRTGMALQRGSRSAAVACRSGATPSQLAVRRTAPSTSPMTPPAADGWPRNGIGEEKRGNLHSRVQRLPASAIHPRCHGCAAAGSCRGRARRRNHLCDVPPRGCSCRMLKHRRGVPAGARACSSRSGGNDKVIGDVAHHAPLSALSISHMARSKKARELRVLALQHATMRLRIAQQLPRKRCLCLHARQARLAAVDIRAQVHVRVDQRRRRKRISAGRGWRRSNQQRKLHSSECRRGRVVSGARSDVQRRSLVCCQQRLVHQRVACVGAVQVQQVDMMSRRRRVCVQLVRRGTAARLHTACGVELRAGRWRQTGWLKRGQPRRQHHTLRRRDAAVFRSSAPRPLRPWRAARRTGKCSSWAGCLAGGVRCQRWRNICAAAARRRRGPRLQSRPRATGRAGTRTRIASVQDTAPGQRVPQAPSRLRCGARGGGRPGTDGGDTKHTAKRKL
jgi:hypothetical protein